MYDTNTHDIREAVIYCRVSSAAQLAKGDGLSSQETRCREHAKHRGYLILNVFRDNMTGGAADRPAMAALLAFLRKRTAPTLVLIDDLNRFSRDVQVHWQLRALLAEAGGKLESPMIEFRDDSDSILVENLLASVSQHQRQKNGEQTKHRMRARALNGYWVFHAPLGLRYEKMAGHGKVLVRDEPLASVIQEALEGFACGRFESQSAVKAFLERNPHFPKTTRGEVRYEEVIRLMRRPHYAGYIEIPQWGVSLRKGQHAGLVSLDTWTKVQARLAAPTRAAFRKDISADFPLRGFVTCDDCGNPLTANWSTSKTGKKHPYYMCFTKGCASYRKSIRRADLEGAFARLLRRLQPTRSLFDLVRAMLKSAWDQRTTQAKAHHATLTRDIAGIDKKITTLLDRIVESDTPSVIAAYETRIAALERDKMVKQDALAQTPKTPRTFDDMFELSSLFLANPWKLWETGVLAWQRIVLKLTLQDRLAYNRKTGLRTPKTTSPFNILDTIQNHQSQMAETKGFEPSRRFPAYSLSRGAPSTARPRLHHFV